MIDVYTCDPFKNLKMNVSIVDALRAMENEKVCVSIYIYIYIYIHTHTCSYAHIFSKEYIYDDTFFFKEYMMTLEHG